MPTLNATSLKAAACRRSFSYFMKTFWPVICPGRELLWDWHIQLMCDSLQEIAERVFAGKPKLYDLCTNISRGTTKSSTHSILFPAWVWTRMPHARIIGASYSDDLALTFSLKNRDVVKSELYQTYFPEVVIRPDQDTKSKFYTTTGGSRSAVGSGGTVQGTHADFICFPHETLVQTSQGEIPIGRIVIQKLPVKVLAAGPDGLRWQEISRYESHPGRPLCRVQFSDGSSLEATHDHPIYVLGSGYVFASQLKSGQEVVCANQVCSGKVQALPQVVPVPVGEDRSVFGRRGVLQSSLCRRTQAQANLEDVQELSQAILGLAGSEGDGGFLQLQMPWGDQSWQEASSLAADRQDELSNLLQIVQGEDWGTWPKSPDVLLSELCRQASFSTDEGRRQLELYSRTGGSSLLREIQEIGAESQEARRASLSSLRRSRGWEGTGCPPHRLRQDERFYGESSRSMSFLSRTDAREDSQSTTLGTKIVSSVVRSVRTPAEVYNLNVAEDHNYFAERVLVHNCIDDPLDPNRAMSEAELHNINHWIENTLSGCVTDKAASVMILVMQRLHQDDPTARMVERNVEGEPERVRWYRIPATTEFQIHPPELESKYVDGLMSPRNLPKEFLDAKRSPKEMGEAGFASQYGQDPVPAGGLIFDVNKLKWGTPPEKFKYMMRFWDKAATSGKEAKINKSPFTAGVKIAKDFEGRFWVLNSRRMHLDSASREKYIAATAREDGRHCEVGVEQEPGSGGKDSAVGTVRRLAGYVCRILVVRGTKESRADEFSVQVNAGNVYLPEDQRRGDSWTGWAKSYVEELKYFPVGRYKDQVDASSGGFSFAAKGKIRVGPLKNRTKQESLVDAQVITV